jgi:hypothetical protein
MKYKYIQQRCKDALWSVCCKTIFIPIIKYRYSLYFTFISLRFPFSLRCIISFTYPFIYYASTFKQQMDVWFLFISDNWISPCLVWAQRIIGTDSNKLFHLQAHHLLSLAVLLPLRKMLRIPIMTLAVILSSWSRESNEMSGHIMIIILPQIPLVFARHMERSQFKYKFLTLIALFSKLDVIIVYISWTSWYNKLSRRILLTLFEARFTNL